jgi:PIN domain nuclease of toxin-antitoxin system
MCLSLPRHRLIVLPITPEIAVQAYSFMPDLHGDPADRIIAATAACNSLELVTSDEKLLTHPSVPTLSTR